MSSLVLFVKGSSLFMHSSFPRTDIFFVNQYCFNNKESQLAAVSLSVTWDYHSGMLASVNSNHKVVSVAVSKGIL